MLVWTHTKNATSMTRKRNMRKKNKGNLMKFRTFLMYVGQFDFQNQNFAGAYKAYDAWLTYPQNHKLVADEPKVLNDSVFDKNQVAYYACLAAYQGKDFDKGRYSSGRGIEV